jgi:3-dehydroquinate synthase
MPKTVHVDLGHRSYPIRIGRGVAPGESLGDARGVRAMIVTDTNVGPLYGERCRQTLATRGVESVVETVPAGEATKTLSSVQGLCERAVAEGLDRSSILLALGGGMVGDLAGFAAAVYLRGVRFLQAPTSLLAMVDSSVGGKTGVNLRLGKNLVGAFHQPLEVAADLDTLATLPAREYVSGLAEVVKYGVIWDAVLFHKIEENAQRIAARELDFLEEIVGRCCEIKAEIVTLDEREEGVRSVLNFGHTMAHALETVSGYGKLLHGEAVSLGMAYAARLSEKEKGLPAAQSGRILNLLARLGLPVAARETTGAAWADLRAAMGADKKTRRSVPRFVLAQDLGSVVYGCEVPDEALEAAYAAGGA